MRTAILANSLPAAINIFTSVKSVSNCEPLVLLCPVGKQSLSTVLLRHAARLVFKPKRLRSLALILMRKVHLLRHPLDHPQTIERLKELKLDVGLHRTGEIYRTGTIQAFRLGILNAHIGLLPHYRGRNVMEWTLLEGGTVGISVFFVDERIDTGTGILFREPVDISHCPTLSAAKKHLFDLDASCFKRALEQLAWGLSGTEEVNTDEGHRYYVMSKLFLTVAQDLFEAAK